MFHPHWPPSLSRHPLSDLQLNLCTLTFPMDLNVEFCIVSLTLISHSGISHVLWQLVQTTRPPLSLPPSSAVVSLVSRFASSSLCWRSPTCPSCLACSKCRRVQRSAGIQPSCIRGQAPSLSFFSLFGPLCCSFHHLSYPSSSPSCYQALHLLI